MSTSDRRLKLRNLDLPQKFLVLAILATVGGGYLAAVANLFAAHSPNDGKVTIRLEEFPAVLREQGPSKLVQKIQESLGIEDVVRRYHGTGGTQLEGALNGSMKNKIQESLVKDGGDKPEVREQAEAVRQMLIQWSKLEPQAREAAYVQGTLVDEKGIALFGPAPAKRPKEADKVTAVKDAFDNYCVNCHKQGAMEGAESMPLDDFKNCNRYCGANNGVDAATLARTTHVHLLGFAVLFSMTGFLFSMTDFPWLVRVLFTPMTLVVQLVEIGCWWLAKLDPFYARMVFYLGPLVATGLAVQLLGVFIDLVVRRRERFQDD